MKNNIIKKIKAIISKIGYTTTGDMQSESSQVYKIITKDRHCLVEGYGSNNIRVIEYIHGQEIDEFTAPYEDLKKWQLSEILNELTIYSKSLTN